MLYVYCSTKCACTGEMYVCTYICEQPIDCMVHNVCICFNDIVNGVMSMVMLCGGVHSV